MRGCWCCDAGSDYKSRGACFDCRKAFKATGVKSFGSLNIPRACPNCGGKFYLMSIYWRPPRRSDLKAWEWSKKFIRSKLDPVEKEIPYQFVPKKYKGKKECK